jgi:hypothetical protein
MPLHAPILPAAQSYIKQRLPLTGVDERSNKAILAGFSGSFTHTHDQRSQGAMTTEILYSSRDAQSITHTPQCRPNVLYERRALSQKTLVL